MSTPTTSHIPPNWDQPFPVRRFTVEEYHRMGDTGVLTEEELLEGLVVPKMIRKPVHCAMVEVVRDALSAVLPTGWCIRSQSAITTEDSEPEPDIAVVRGAARDYLEHHPGPGEIAMVVEAAETSLDRDRNQRRLYARAGIAEYWIVNIQPHEVARYSKPASGEAPRYGDEKVYGRTDSIPLFVGDQQATELPAFPDAAMTPPRWQIVVDRNRTVQRLLNWLAILVLLSVIGCGRHSKVSKQSDQPATPPISEATPHQPSKGAMVLPISAPHTPARPEENGWTTEIAHDRTKPVLRAMEQHLATGAGDLAELSATGFSATVYDVQDFDVVYARSPLQVSRLRSNCKPSVAGTLQGFLSQLPGVGAPATRRAELKTVRVNQDDGHVETQLVVHAFAEHQGHQTQYNAEWICEWDFLAADATTLKQIEVVRDSVEMVKLDSSTPMLVDRTEEVLSGLECYQTQLLPSSSFWLRRLPSRLGLDIVGLHGIAMGDVNGDGRDDLYLCMQAGLPNRMLVQTANGALRDMSTELRLDFADFSRHALIVDFDNDGDGDMVVHLNSSVVFLRNEGPGGFAPMSEHGMQGMPYSICAADFDNDSLVDVYVTCREAFASAGRRADVLGNPVPYHDANNGSPNALLRNVGAFHFEEVTQQVGLDNNNRRFSYAASWEDFDQDGDQDLYVANDFGRNNLYRNDGGRFTDVAAVAGVEDISAGMSVSWGDADLDGRMDVYVGNMFSSAGNRIAYQQRFKPSLSEQERQQFQRHARGNTLFLNRANETFEDVTGNANVRMGRWAWSSNFVDLNNDGLEDLAVANGFVTNDGTDDL